MQLLFLRRLADMLNGLRHRVGCGDDDDVRCHNAACGVFVVFEQLLDLVGLLRPHMFENLVRLVRGELPQHVGGVVGRKLRDDLGQRLGVEIVHNIAPNRLIEHHHDLGSRVRWQREQNP